MNRFKVGDTIRMPNYPLAGGYRCWKIVACNLGATKQEGTWELRPLDVDDNEPIQVPCVMLETHQDIVVV